MSLLTGDGAPRMKRDGATAREALAGASFDIVRRDMRMAGLDGITLVSAVSVLSAPPGLLAELSALMASETAGITDVARLVERDVSVAGKLLQLANSAFVASPRAVTRVEDAISLLGLSVVQAVALSAHALAAYRPAKPVAGFSIGAIERHAAAVAVMTRRLLPPGPKREQACVAALLQDIGWLILAATVPDRLGALIAAAQAIPRRPLHVVERERGGPTHAELGAHLLALWGLPEPIVSAVARHHDGPAPSEPGLDVVTAVQIAGALTAEQHAGA